MLNSDTFIGILHTNKKLALWLYKSFDPGSCEQIVGNVVVVMVTH